MRISFGIAVLLASTTLATPAFADAGDPVEIGEGVTLDPILDVRFRIETADQPTFPDNASSITVRGRAGLEIASDGFSFLAESEGTLALDNNYNDTIPSNGIEPFPVIADPDSFDLNRIQVAYKSDTFGVTVGRQRIILADARFVGNVGWRQNEQTFDAVRGTAKVGPLALDATYAIQQNTIFGSESPNKDFEGDFVFLNGQLDLSAVKALAYSYTIDYDTRLAFSSQTFGGELKGTIPAGPFKINLRAGLATQSDTGANPNNYDAGYLVGEGAIQSDGWTVRLQYEELGSDDGVAAFQTPLATAHKFNGFADLFLVTPATGLRDTNIRVAKTFTIPGLTTFNAGVTFHEFDSDFGGIDYGNEFDAVLGFKAGPVGILAKYSNYDAVDFGVDTDRFTLQAGISF